MALTIGLTTGHVISQFIGKQIVGQAITDASTSIYQSIRSIYNTNAKIDKVLLELDVKQKIETVESLIHNIQNYNSTIEHCLTSVHDIILNIKEDLQCIDLKLRRHKKKYWSKWRKCNCSKEVNNLKMHSVIIDKRLDYLLKALEIEHFNTKLLAGGLD